MAKKRKDPNIEAAARAGRSAARAEYVEAMRSGVRFRAATFTDRKREASRKACRSRAWD